MAEIGTNISTAWVTLATTDGYAIGALVLAHSLRRVQTKHKLHVLYSAGVSPALSAQLREVFEESTEVDVLDSGDAENLALIGRPDLGVTFTKLYCWRLTQYSKVVFLDADTFVVQNCDELFDRPEISAAPDIGWPDLFNTGVFVLVPSLETYRKLMQFAISHGSFDGGDQGLLNAYFSDWRESDASHRLSFVYNVTAAAIYSYAAAMKKFAPQIKIIHFLGKQKPWLIHYEGVTEGMTFVSEYHQQWHDLYVKMVKEHAPQSSLSTLSLSVSRSSDYDLQQPSSSSLNQPVNCPFTLGDSIDMFQYQYRQCVRLPSHESESQLSVEVETPTQEEVPQSGESPSSSGQPKVAGRYDAWEAGRPDYLGADAFENIQKAMDKSLE